MSVSKITREELDNAIVKPGQVLVDVDKASEKVAGSNLIEAADNYKLPPARGTIRKLGSHRFAPDGSRMLYSVSVGDRIAFHRNAGNGFNVDGNKDDRVVFLEEEHIYSILPQDENHGLIQRVEIDGVEYDVDIPMIPLFERVLIKRDTKEEASKGGIILPDAANAKQKEHETGTLVAVGPGKLKKDGSGVIAPDVRVGQRVVYEKYAGTVIYENDQEYLVTRLADLIGVMEG